VVQTFRTVFWRLATKVRTKAKNEIEDMRNVVKKTKDERKEGMIK
jgi:hypothetical protein